MKVEKKTGAFYIIGYLLELIIKYGDWKKKLINLVNLGSKYGNFLHIFLKNPPLYFFAPDFIFGCHGAKILYNSLHNNWIPNHLMMKKK